MTRATERVESPPSSWAATPETCGAAMLVPLMVLVAALLEPTYAARIEEPGACAHAWPGLRAAWALGVAGATLWVGGEDLHVDASAVVGERGQRAPLSGGANEQLVRGGD